MNLSEERNYQKLMETLEAMELSEENRRLAEQYLDMSMPERRELLKEAKRQDFSRLDEQKQYKVKLYGEHLQKRGKTQELERFVRLSAAIGGSTDRKSTRLNSSHM